MLAAGGIGGTIWYFMQNSQSTSKTKGYAEYDTLIQPTHYRTIASTPFKNVILETDLGPVKVFIQPNEKHSIAFHQTYMKYVEMTYRGDTLIIHANKTPKSTRENPIYRQIYIYLPEIHFYSGEASQTFFSKIKSEQLKVKSRSSYIRFSTCEIDKLELYTNHACNFVIDEDCYLGNIKADINSGSAFSCLGFIQNQVSIKAEDFKRIDLSKENVKKLLVVKKF